jgi:hypothetical protein
MLTTAPTVANVSCNELYVLWRAWSPDVDIGFGFNGAQLVITSYRYTISGLCDIFYSSFFPTDK